MLYLKILVVILFVWLAQTLFVFEATKAGFNGWDDWGLLFTYDAFKANNLVNFPSIANFIGTPYILSEIYNIGPLKDIFGLNQTLIRNIEVLFKALAALSIGFLVFKLTSNKLFFGLTVFLFIIFPSTAGPLSHIIFTGAYLSLIFICFSILSYKKVFLSSLLFFLAIIACPSRFYLIVPIPFLWEVLSQFKSFKLSRFFSRVSIYYLPLLLFQIFLMINGDRPQQAFMPHLEALGRFKQVFSGNLYTLSLPLQFISSLFIDPSILQKFIPNQLVLGSFVLNLIFAIFSFLTGFILRGKNFINLSLKILGSTIVLETILYILAVFSMHENQITYKNYTIGPDYVQGLIPSLFQSFIGVFVLILGMFLAFEYFGQQRKNKILKVMLVSLIWAILSEFILFMTTHWYTMLDQSFDRYIIACSLGAVIFAGGFFTLLIQSLQKLSPNFKKVSFTLIGLFFVFLTYQNFQLLNKFYYDWNENQGESSAWQDFQYNKFLDKFGANNLSKSVLLYIDIGEKEPAFNQGSFVYNARFRLFYDKSNQLIRDNCKTVTSDLNFLKTSFKVQDGEKGFLVESVCTNPNLGYEYKTIFYPLNKVFAYKMENKEFIDITKDILAQF